MVAHLYKLEDAVKIDAAIQRLWPPPCARNDLLVQHVVFDGDGLFLLMTTTTSFVNPELGDLYVTSRTSETVSGHRCPLETGVLVLQRVPLLGPPILAHGSSPIHRHS